MTRPLRIEFAGALYHVTARGNSRERIYLDDRDRATYMDVLAGVIERHNWLCHAYCLMGNHYHLLIETPDANLSKGMRDLNGVYTRRFNQCHARVGHVFQGRFKSILVDGNSYLLELSRYIVLNPVRAAMVHRAQDWPWSSYRATAGLSDRPAWLTVDWILAAFAKRRFTAVDRYQAFIAAGNGQPAPWQHLKNQIFLGSDAFVERMQGMIEPDKDLSEIPSSQRRPVPKTLHDYSEETSSRDEAIRAAYASGGYTMKKIGLHFGLHYSRVSRIISSGAKGKT